jgi:hypothetical protein
MSAEIVVQNPMQSKQIGVAVRCLLWKMCPVFAQKEKGCSNRGSSACKEFIRLQVNADIAYKGNLR